MAALGLDLAELYANLGTVLGINRTSTNWDTTTKADIDRVIRMGKRRYYNAYAWSYLYQHISILVAGPFSTGTVTIADGIVTLTGGIFPANAALSYLSLTDSTTSTVTGLYEVESRDSDTQITLVDTSINVATAESFTLHQFRYALPANFAGFVDPISKENESTSSLREAGVLPDYFLKGLTNRDTLLQREPELYAITMLHPNEETGVPVFYLDLYPLPDKTYVLKTRIKLMPGDALLEVGEIEHPVFSECLQSSILGTAEIMFSGQAGIHSQRFAELLPEAVLQDRKLRGTRSVRPRQVDHNNLPRDYQLIVGNVVFDSDAILP